MFGISTFKKSQAGYITWKKIEDNLNGNLDNYPVLKQCNLIKKGEIEINSTQANMQVMSFLRKFYKYLKQPVDLSGTQQEQQFGTFQKNIKNIRGIFAHITNIVKKGFIESNGLSLETDKKGSWHLVTDLIQSTLDNRIISKINVDSKINANSIDPKLKAILEAIVEKAYRLPETISSKDYKKAMLEVFDRFKSVLK